MMLVLESLVQFYDIRVVQSAHDLDLIEHYRRIPHVLLADDLHYPQIMRKHLQPSQIHLPIGTLSHLLNYHNPYLNELVVILDLLFPAEDEQLSLY